MEDREKMLSNWEDTLVAIFLAQTGEVDIRHVRDDDGGVTGIAGEMILEFEEALAKNFTKQGSKAIETAKKEAAELTSEQTFLSLKDVFDRIGES